MSSFWSSTGTVVPAAASLVESSNRGSPAAPVGDVVVYRTHGPEETADIAATGRYRVPPGTNEAKHFFETEREARALAARFESYGIMGPYSISTGTLPKVVADRAYRVDIGLYNVRVVGPAR